MKEIASKALIRPNVALANPIRPLETMPRFFCASDCFLYRSNLESEVCIVFSIRLRVVRFVTKGSNVSGTSPRLVATLTPSPGISHASASWTPTVSGERLYCTMIDGYIIVKSMIATFSLSPGFGSSINPPLSPWKSWLYVLNASPFCF